MLNLSFLRRVGLGLALLLTMGLLRRVGLGLALLLTMGFLRHVGLVLRLLLPWAFCVVSSSLRAAAYLGLPAPCGLGLALPLLVLGVGVTELVEQRDVVALRVSYQIITMVCIKIA